MSTKKHISGFHIMISANGSRGDINPLLALAIELRNQGVQNITFLINDYYHDLITQHGFKYISTGMAESYLAYTNDNRIWDNKHDCLEIGWDQLIRPAIESSYKAIESVYKIGDKILVIGLQTRFNGAFMAAENLNIPSVCITLAPQPIAYHSNTAPPPPFSWLPSWFPNFLKKRSLNKLRKSILKRTIKKDYFRQLNGMRRSRGLTPIGDFTASKAFSNNSLHICLFPSWFGMPVDDWPKNVHLTNFPLFDGIKTEHDISIDVQQFIGEQGKPILITFGTGFFDTSEAFKICLKACEKLGYPALFVGGEVDDGFISSKKFKYIRYIDFESILPHCLAVVHHGGIGTLSQAIRAGIPQLIRPTAFDQFDNADRVYKLGLGSFILPNKFNVKNVSKVLDFMLKTKPLERQLKHFSLLINQNDAIERAVELIEDSIIKPNNTICIHPLEKAIKQYIKKDEKIEYLNIPLPKRKTKLMFTQKPLNGTHEVLFIVLKHLKQNVSLRGIYNQYPQAMTLKDILDYCHQIPLRVKALKCSAENLTHLSLPCLIQWQYNRFIILVGFSENSIHIQDPFAEKKECLIHEFGWKYSDIAIEIYPPETAI